MPWCLLLSLGFWWILNGNYDDLPVYEADWKICASVCLYCFRVLGFNIHTHLLICHFYMYIYSIYIDRYVYIYIYRGSIRGIFMYACLMTDIILTSFRWYDLRSLKSRHCVTFSSCTVVTWYRHRRSVTFRHAKLGRRWSVAVQRKDLGQLVKHTYIYIYPYCRWITCFIWQ